MSQGKFCESPSSQSVLDFAGSLVKDLVQKSMDIFTIKAPTRYSLQTENAIRHRIERARREMSAVDDHSDVQNEHRNMYLLPAVGSKSLLRCAWCCLCVMRRTEFILNCSAALVFSPTDNFRASSVHRL